MGKQVFDSFFEELDELEALEEDMTPEGLVSCEEMRGERLRVSGAMEALGRMRKP